MRTRSLILSLTIILAPFAIAVGLAVLDHNPASGQTGCFNDGRVEGRAQEIICDGIRVTWEFCPDWSYKPLFAPSDEYLVFVFHYANMNDDAVYLTPSYRYRWPSGKGSPSNEEIAAYIEDDVEDLFHISEETPMTFKVPIGSVRHDLAVFEKKPSSDAFDVDIDVFDAKTLRLHYEKSGTNWINPVNTLLDNYGGKG